ncbi:helix-turn-helix domain-containing protein [Nocardia sp. BSTN01]|uniref:GlxA family transcriptional regulator n=1 Tax=Nocardia sp. BSTN01 TaxID=2783665 RepID=UPI0018904550|nr:helix-turn-helix domain-containing protein [Nocardia sp. BSTN01]MBF5000392.1 helix-turn-helix domain-containing protein [Nocardia sp. BSTN01]
MDVAVFVMDRTADFGLAAVLEVFDMANALRGELEPAPEPWTVHVVSVSDTARTGRGHLVPALPLSRLTVDLDLMIVPAVNAIDASELIDLVSDPANQLVLQRISEAAERGVHLAAACTGTFFLAESGALDGSRATTSWWLGPAFRRRYPNVDVQEGHILCRDKLVTTAGAVLSHLDLALSLVAAQSPALAEITSRFLLIGHRHSQIEFAVPEVIARGDSLVAAFERWVRDHISKQFRLADAARSLGVTVRSLQRATQGEIGMAPRDFVDEIRLERATQLLRTTSLTVDAVAAKVGYQNASTLRTLFRRRRNRTIAEIRSSPLSWEAAPASLQ